MIGRLLLGLAAALLMAGAAAADARPDLTLTGEMTGADHETYREVGFRVPSGVTSILVEFDYTGREQKAVIDLGLRDPQRFRGWSGGNKARFILTETWATPSYLPGPLPAGEWKLILGAPNLRKDGRAAWTAKISFGRHTAFEGFAPAPLKDAPGWYRGDLHLHTGHSDGSCASRGGQRGPCPLFRTLEAAADRGLDFVAVTEHNTTSHHQALAELQPFFDDLVLIPGREITTFRGHLNVFGVTAPLDFQLGSPRAATLDAILDQVEAAGGLASINHPGLPSGEVCMGCGWTAATDYARIGAVEAINGGALAQTGGRDGPLSGIPFWEARLDQGFRLTAVGGSDNHDAGRDPAQPSAVGAPTTVVYASNLSQAGLLAGLRSGRVFVDVEGTKDRLLDVTARARGASAHMGQALTVRPGVPVSLEIRLGGVAGGKLAYAGPAARAVIDAGVGPLAASETRTVRLAPQAARGWLRVDVRGPDGKLWLLGNPIFFNSAP